MKTDLECPYCNQPLKIYHDDGYGQEENEPCQQKEPLFDRGKFDPLTLCWYESFVKGLVDEVFMDQKRFAILIKKLDQRKG